MRLRILALLTVLFLVSCVKEAEVRNERVDKTFNSAKKKITPLDEEQLLLYLKAKELSDKGKFEDSALLYEKILKLNNSNPKLFLLASYAFFDSGNYEKSLEYALKAAEFDTDYDYEIFVQIANSYDMLGESEKAIKYYKKALKDKPDYNYLYYNLGITYYRMGEVEKARVLIKKALTLEPNMSEAHLALGEIYYKDNYIIPALLAYSRFMLIEYSGEKSDFAFKRVKAILKEGVTAENGEINILFNSDEPDYDGDFSAVALGFNMKKAIDLGEKIIPERDIDRLAEWFETLFTLLDELKEGNSGFVWEFYVPFFVEMKNRGFVKPFVIVLYYREYPSAAKAWLEKKENNKLFEEFAQWNENYRFNAPEVDVSF